MVMIENNLWVQALARPDAISHRKFLACMFQDKEPFGCVAGGQMFQSLSKYQPLVSFGSLTVLTPIQQPRFEVPLK